MMSDRFRGALAVCLALTTTALLALGPVCAGESALFTGRVIGSDGISPYPGAVISLVDQATDRVHHSAPTTEEGTFLIDSAPAGTYAVVAETSGGAFVASEDLELHAGNNEPMALRLAPGAVHSPLAAGQSTDDASQMKTWKKWTIAGVIILVGLLAIVELTDDNEDVASAF